MAKEAKKVKVKFTHCLAGERFVWNVGDTADLPADEARRLIDAGFAEKVGRDKVEEPEESADPPAA